MTTKKAPTSAGGHLVSLLIFILAGVFLVAGIGTWTVTATSLRAQNITVAADASSFAGQVVDTPWEAWSQADIIDKHALAATDGKTYSEMDKEDPLRAVAMNGSLLRSALFTSVIAFGVALLVAGLGVALALIGVAVRRTETRALPCCVGTPAPLEEATDLA